MKPSATPEASLADQRLCRRRFLTWGALTAAMSLYPRSVVAGIKSLQPPERALAFLNTHTGESLRTVYWLKGDYLPDALSAVDYVLRDHRTDEVKTIDPQLLDLLHAICEELEVYQPFHIISGYRSPATNAYLRSQSRRVAQHSLHMDGKAVDVRLPEYSAATVRSVAMSLQGGGVGYYPRSEFVHLDVGRIRYW
jgi:uncharacterized protein YcbK (DUF882 family)